MSKDIVVASTTDSQRDVDLAAGIPPAEAGKEPETPPEIEVATKEETPEGETPETKADSEPVQPEEGEEEVKGVKPKKGGWQERVDKLTKRSYELRDSIERLEEENQRLREQQTGRDEQRPPVRQPVIEDELSPEPDENKFLEEGKSYKEFLNALWDYREKKKEIEARHKQAEEVRKSEDARLQSNLDSYIERADEARERYPDWDKVVGQPIPLPKSVHAAIIEMENGPDVAYYLGTHPEVCEEIMEMSPIRAAAHVGFISATLMPNDGTNPPKTGDQAPERKVTSSAPAPIKPVTGTSTKSAVPLDETDYRTYRRIRDDQEANRYK